MRKNFLPQTIAASNFDLELVNFGYWYGILVF